MKKLLLATALLIAASATTFAAGNIISAPEVLAEKNLSVSIRSQLLFPDFLREKEGEHDATIIFKVNSCGTITVSEIQTDDEDLKADLMGQATAIRISADFLDTRDTYKVVVRFKTL